MANSEDSLLDELRKDFEKKWSAAFCYKLHGNPMQPSLPDLIVVMERKAALVEAKWASDSDFEKPLLEVFASKLSAKQAMNLGQIAALDGPLRARLLIGGAVDCDELPGGRGVVCVALDVTKVAELREHATLTLLQCAMHLLDLRMSRPTEFPCGHLLQMQLHSTGDAWFAGHLLGGTQYCGPIDSFKDKDKTFEEA